MNKKMMKAAAASEAMSYLVPKLSPKVVIGIGTGSTTNLFIDALANFKDQISTTVASSKISEARLRKHQIPVSELKEVENMDFYVDGADESNKQLQLVKGGGGALTREKIVASVAREFVCIADESKLVDRLGVFPLPVEVIPMASQYVTDEITKIGGRPILRDGFVTDNQNIILDIHDLHIEDPTAMEKSLNMIAGVVTNGIFSIRPGDILFLGTTAGVKKLYAKK